MAPAHLLGVKFSFPALNADQIGPDRFQKDWAWLFHAKSHRRAWCDRFEFDFNRRGGDQQEGQRLLDSGPHKQRRQ